ncbi:hypothetical protein EDB92DRAFT_1844093 [Lactarius akahatsu]|uniref:F-box domain-containing protein n=1 Tax=Lactarius akahatsu TaxID=416441 RepID=A0AAD4QFN3_9AGAM|nr:hypothetical protein EDB92DRAFT_1844093 [Lactarius akahatsu]
MSVDLLGLQALDHSERPGYNLNDDILIDIFNYYRLDDENAWNIKLGWCKLSHVCRRWRQLVHSSAFRLGLQILCTNGSPALDTLDHLPSLPLFVDYRDTIATITQQDELAIRYALLLWDRVRRIDLHLPPSIFHRLLTLMGEPFSMLEHLSLSPTTKEDTNLVLPKSFLAPNLRHLMLHAIDLPNRLQLLFSTVSLVTLVLTDIQASGYFPPRPLVAHLSSLHQLEELTIEFSIPIPRPSAERELLGKRLTPVPLPNLKHLRFQGVSAYLECLVAQIRAPLLERLDIMLFNQIAWVLPHLSHFINTTEAFKLPIATVSFGNEVTMITDRHITQQHGAPFTLRVMCKELDWQIDCAAQICCALMTPLSGVQELRLDFDGARMLTRWQNGEIDSTTWHELLRSFIGVNKLCICAALSEEVSRALQVGEDGLDPGLLPGLQEIVTELYGKRADDLFGWFVDARRLADRPVRLMPSDTMEGSGHDAMEGSGYDAMEGSGNDATEGSGYDALESIGYDAMEDNRYNATEADHVDALINALRRSPHGNVAHLLKWKINNQEDPDNQAVHGATAILDDIPVGKAVGTSKHFAVRAAAQSALVFLEQNGILYPRG